MATAPASQNKVSSRRRKSYRRSVLHRAALATPSLPPPKGSLRQAAQACVQRLQSNSALPVSTTSARKRPLPTSPSVLPNHSPLAQRICRDLQLGSSEIDSPEKEGLRSCVSLENSPSPISPPNVKGFPPPAPLAFTPSKTKDEIVKTVSEKVCWTCGESLTPDHKCKEQSSVSPTPPMKVLATCQNCEGPMSPTHQCELNSPPALDPLPLCHYCCHRGTGNYPVHYFLQCICDDRECTCRCYCTGAQLEHKLEVFPVEFLGKSPVDALEVPRAKDIAEARVKKLANKPCWNPSCVEDMLKYGLHLPDQ